MSDAPERPPFRAELFGGPLDGQTVTVEQQHRRLELPIPPGRSTLADLDADPLLPTFKTAVYELAEWTYVEPRDPFLPKRITVGGRFKFVNQS